MALDDVSGPHRYLERPNYRPVPVRIGFVLMQKNEGQLLNAWIAYHKRLAKPDDIIILDNGSSCPDTLHVLEEAVRVGLNVSNEFSTNLHYQQKHVIISGIVGDLQRKGCDFIVPLDCDEFLAAETQPWCLGFDPPEISAALGRHRGKPGFFRARGSFSNIPGQADEFFFYEEDSVFFGGSAITGLDHGYHNAQTVDATEPTLVDLALLHFRFKRPEIAKVQAAEKLKMRLPNFAEKTISEYRGAGAHLRMFFQGDPGIGPGDRFGGQHYRYPAFFQVLSSEKIPFPSGLFCQDDRYASERGLIDGIPLSRQVLREGVTERELLLIHRHVANRDCAVIYSPCALAEILPTFGVWRTVVIGLQEAAFRLWVANETIRELMQIGRLSIHHVNLGSVAVNNLGYPSAPAGLQFVERYVRTVIRTLPIAPDTFILIGRYRVAAGLAAILESSEPAPRIIVLNFWSRAHYHGMLRFCECVDTEDDAVVLRPAVGIDRDALRSAMEAMMLDPR